MNDTAQSIESELHRTRARLDDHLDELARRISPGQLLDEALDYAREGQGAAFVRNLGAGVRDNPLPVALVGAGLAWLIFATSRPRAGGGADMHDELAERARRAGEGLSRGVDETAEAFQARLAEARASVMGLTRQAEETASSFTTRVQEAFEGVQDQAQQRWRQAREAARGWTGELRDAARQGAEASQEAGRSVAWALQDNPLLLGTVGIAAGALVGALLPLTEPEARLLREPARDVADELADRAARAARAGMEAAAHPGDPARGGTA